MRKNEVDEKHQWGMLGEGGKKETRAGGNETDERWERVEKIIYLYIFQRIKSTGTLHDRLASRGPYGKYISSILQKKTHQDVRFDAGLMRPGQTSSASVDSALTFWSVCDGLCKT